MKGKRRMRFMALSAAVLLTLSGTCLASAEGESFLRVATAAAGTPTIDGTMDEVWKSATEYETTEDRLFMEGNENFGKAAKGKFRVLWDSQNLYVYAQVTDPVLNADNELPHMQDSICIQVEEDGSQKGAFEPNVDKNFFVNYR